eukprot:958018-Rhodomonas_salina.2
MEHSLIAAHPPSRPDSDLEAPTLARLPGVAARSAGCSSAPPARSAWPFSTPRPPRRTAAPPHAPPPLSALCCSAAAHKPQTRGPPRDPTAARATEGLRPVASAGAPSLLARLRAEGGSRAGCSRLRSAAPALAEPVRAQPQYRAAEAGGSVGC